jgi:ankyrin repeat protein
LQLGAEIDSIPALESAELFHDALILPEQDGRTALMGAADNGRTTTVQSLIAAGADPDLQDTMGDTALIKACLCSATVQALIDAGADLNLQDQHGRTVLMHASRNDRPATVQALLEAGADRSIRDKVGHTCSF